MRRMKQFDEGGAAIVEIAIMLLIFLPLIFYTFFISDIMAHFLDAQETVISTVWDFSTAPLGVKKNGETSALKNVSGAFANGSIDNYNRVQYADHTSARLALDVRSEDWQHNQPFAHMCWGTSTAKDKDGNDVSYKEGNFEEGYYGAKRNKPSQVSCQYKGRVSFPTPQVSIAGLDVGVENFGLKLFIKEFDSNGASDGGRYICWAKGWVFNYLIPKKLFSEFTETEMISARSSKETSSASSVQNEEGVINFRAKASLIAGDWSSLADHVYGSEHHNLEVYYVNDYTPQSEDNKNKGKDFYRRVREFYRGNLEGVFALDVLATANLKKDTAIGDYLTKLLDEKLSYAMFTQIQELTDRAGGLIAQLGEHIPAIGLWPSPLSLWMAATYSHRGSEYNHSDYSYKPESDYFLNDELYTSSTKSYLQANNRGYFYLGAKESL